MNYAFHYQLLIDRARGRVLNGYRERHHVIPRCRGGDSSKGNIVCLTPEEHFVAHQLLTKMNPDDPKLTHAAMAMAKHVTGRKAYGWLRRRFAASLIGKKHSAESVERMAAAHRGKHFSKEHRAKMSRSLIGNQRTKGKPLSAEHKAKVSKANLGRTHSLDMRAKFSVALILRHAARTPEERSMSLLKGWTTRRKNGWKVKPFSMEHRTKLSATSKGRKPMLGKKHSLEIRTKMSLARRGKPNPRKVSIPIIAKMFAPQGTPPEPPK